MGRTDDMLIVKGVNIFPMQIEKVLMSIPEVGTDYQIVLERENYMDKLTVKVEINAILIDMPGSLDGLLTALAERGVNIENAYGFVLEVEDTRRVAEPLKGMGFKPLSNTEIAAL